MNASRIGKTLGVVAISAALVCGPTPSASAQTARAMVLRDVVVDGRLDEWPSDLERYPMLNQFQVYGPTDIDEADLEYSSDLCPSYRVAYDPDENLLYLAVEVRDDDLVIGHDHSQTDACEVYLHGGGSAASGAPMQYVVVPGGWGGYGRGMTNPGLANGEIGRTRTQAAFQRSGDITTYEWGLEVFDRFPDSRTELTPGAEIAFDVVVVDKDDGHGNAARVPWGPPMPQKTVSAARLGKLVLLNQSGNLAAAIPRPSFASDRLQFDADMEQFGRDMEQLGADMAGLATGMAALGLEQLEKHLERLEDDGEKLPAYGPEGISQLQRARLLLGRQRELSARERGELRRELREARRELAQERRRLSGMGADGDAIVRVIHDAMDFLGAAFILMTIAMGIGLIMYMGRRGKASAMKPEHLTFLSERLETVEQRLTDTYEVMLDLSEKADRADLSG